jgi:hypothetical protein
MCARCTKEMEGCRLCKDDDNTQCKICKTGYALETDDEGNQYCTRRCMPGMFAKKMTLTASEGFETMRDLSHEVCADCGSTCEECKGEATFCLLCTDSTKFALSDGTCAASCPAATFVEDGRCHKCGPHVATCKIDETTKEYKVLTCETDFFVHPTMKV